MHRSKQRVRVVELPPCRRQWNHVCFYLGVGGSGPKRVRADTSPSPTGDWPSIGAVFLLDPITRNFHTAPGALGRDRKDSLTSKFVRIKLPNYTRPIARFTWSCDGRSPSISCHSMINHSRAPPSGGQCHRTVILPSGVEARHTLRRW